MKPLTSGLSYAKEILTRPPNIWEEGWCPPRLFVNVGLASNVEGRSMTPDWSDEIISGWVTSFEYLYKKKANLLNVSKRITTNCSIYTAFHLLKTAENHSRLQIDRLIVTLFASYHKTFEQQTESMPFDFKFPHCIRTVSCLNIYSSSFELSSARDTCIFMQKWRENGQRSTCCRHAWAHYQATNRRSAGVQSGQSWRHRYRRAMETRQVWFLAISGIKPGKNAVT